MTTLLRTVPTNPPPFVDYVVHRGAPVARASTPAEATPAGPSAEATPDNRTTRARNNRRLGVATQLVDYTRSSLGIAIDAYMLKLEAMEGALSHLANQGEATPLAFFVDASSVRCARKEAYAVLRWN